MISSNEFRVVTKYLPLRTANPEARLDNFDRLVITWSKETASRCKSQAHGEVAYVEDEQGEILKTAACLISGTDPLEDIS